MDNGRGGDKVKEKGRAGLNGRGERAGRVRSSAECSANNQGRSVEAVFARREMGGATLRVCRPRLQKRCDGRRKTRSIVPCTDQHHPSRSPLSLSLSYGFVRLKMSKCTFLIGIRSSRDPRIRPRPLLQLTSLSAGGRGRGSAERVKAEAVSLPPEGMGWE